MKKYSSYQKTEKVYFSGEFAFPIVLVAIASLISYVLLYLFGIGIAILFNLVISWLSYGYLYYYGKSNIGITFDFLKGVLLFISVLLFVDYGVYVLVVYQKSGVFNLLYFQLWLSILFGVPILYYCFQYLRYFFEARKQALRYFKVSLTVHHDRELLIQIDNIQFVNTTNVTMSDIKLEKAPCFYSQEELKKYDSRNRNHYLEQNYYDGRINMPFDSNFLYMSWYSIIEDKYYDIELPFPYEKLTIEQEKYPTDVSAILRGKKAKKLNLHIYENGGICLFNEDTILIDHSESTPTAITEEKRNEKIALHRSSQDYYKNPKAFSELIQKIKFSNGIEERFQIKNKLILWAISVSGLKGNNYFDVFDVSFNEYKSEKESLQEVLPRFLPNKIEIVYRGDYLYRWLILNINMQELYHCIQKITNQNEQIPVSFNLVFENASNTDLTFTISCNEKSEVFTNWEIQIDKDRKQSMENHFLDKDDDETKGLLLKET